MKKTLLSLFLSILLLSVWAIHTNQITTYFGKKTTVDNSVAFEATPEEKKVKIVELPPACQELTIDIGAAFIFPCEPTSFGVLYCNNGMEDANNVVIDVELDPIFSMFSVNVPSTIVGNTINVDIGSLPQGACQRFDIEAFVSCTALPNRTYCSEAMITSDCIPDPALTSGINSEINCDNDGVTFSIVNDGTTTWNDISAIIIIDELILLQLANDTVDIITQGIIIIDELILLHGSFDSIPVTDSLVFSLPLDPNNFYQIEIGNGAASFNIPDWVEGCDETATTGFPLQYMQNSRNNNQAFECHEITQYPNYNFITESSKLLAIPQGFGPPHYIKQNVGIQYQIQFLYDPTEVDQIVIEDVLPPFLDNSTIVLGASSDPYTMIQSANNLIFTINNPNPTSFGFGFIQFYVEQMLDVPIGTVINNVATVTLDNEPLPSINYFHTIAADAPTALPTDNFLLSATTPENLVVCGDSDTITVTVANQNSLPMADLEVHVFFPNDDNGLVSSDFILMPGVHWLNPYAEEQPVFWIEELQPNDSITFQFLVEANCDLITFAEDNPVEIDFELRWNDDTAILASFNSSDNALNAPINILVPNLILEEFENQDYQAFVRETYTRTMTISNTSGQGYVKDFLIIHSSPEGLTINANSTNTFNTNAALFFNDTSYEGDFVYQIDADEIMAIGDGDEFFEEGELLIFTETVTVEGCEDLNSTYQLVWNCNPHSTDFCDEFTFGADVTIGNGTPIIDLIVDVSPDIYSTCAGPDNPFHITYLFINNGEEEVPGAGTAYFDYLNLGSSFVSGVVTPFKTTHHGWDNFTVNGNAIQPEEATFGNACFIANGKYFHYDSTTFLTDIDTTDQLIDQNGDNIFFDLPVGDTLIFEFDVWRVCDDLFGENAFFGLPCFDSTSLECASPLSLSVGGSHYFYNSQCGENFNSHSSATVQSYRLPKGTELVNVPSDIYQNEPFNVTYKVGERIRSVEMCPDDSMLVEITLPSGITFLPDSSFMTQTYDGGITLVDNPQPEPIQLISTIGNTYTLLLAANRPTPIGYQEDIWQYCLDLQFVFDNPSGGCTSTEVIMDLFSYASCASCSTCVQEWNENCQSIIFQTHSSESCDGTFPGGGFGIKTVGFTLERVNYDPWQDHLCSIPTNPDNINRKAGMPADTVRATFPAYFLGDPLAGYDSLMVEICYEHALRSRWLKFIEGQAYFSNDIDSFITNIETPPYETPELIGFNDNNRCYRFNISNAIPTNVQPQNGDSLLIELDFEILPQDYILADGGGRDLVEDWKAQVYLVKNNEIFSTDIYGNVFEFSQNVLAGHNNSTRFPEGCETVNWVYGSNQNATRSNPSAALFPYEFRPEATQDSITILVPDNWRILNDSFRLQTTATSADLAGTSSTPIVVYQTVYPDTVIDPTSGRIKLIFINGKDDIVWQKFEVFGENTWKQGIPITFEPTCAAQESTGNSDELTTPMGLTYVRAFPGKSIEFPFSETGDKTRIFVNYTPPKYELTPVSLLQNPETDTVSWNLIWSNLNNITTENNWLAFENQSGKIQIDSLFETTNNTMTSIPLMDYYVGQDTFVWAKLDTLMAAMQRTFRVVGQYQNCALDSVHVFQSFSCTAYPEDPSTADCLSSETYLKLSPIPSNLQIEILETPEMPTDLCAELPYEIQISNINAGNANNLTMRALLPSLSALNYVEGSSQMAYPSNADFMTIPDPILDDAVLYWNLGDAMDSPLWGLAHGDSSMIRIRFSLKTDCPFTSADVLTFFANANNNCGSIEEAVTNSPEPITINGLESSGTTFSVAILEEEVVSPCGDAAMIQFQIENTGNATTIGNEQLTLTLPNSITWSPTDLTILNGDIFLQNTTPQVVGNPNGTQLIWNMNNSFPADSLLIWTIYLQTSTNEFDCGTFPINLQLEELTEVACIDGGSCNVSNNLFDFTETIAVELGDLAMTNLIFETTDAGNDSVWVNYSVNIGNTGGAMDGWINLDFFEANTTSLFYQDSINTVLTTNDTTTVTGQFKAAALAVCPIGLMIDGCTCNSAAASFVFPTFTDSSEVILCPNETINFFGTTLSEVGIYCQEFINANDCDSIICVEVLMSDTFNIVEPITICAGDTLDFNGDLLFNNGLFCQTLQTIDGCDSTHCIDLMVLDTFYTSEMISICAGDIFDFNGQLLTISGTTCQSFTAINGCDSTHCIELMVLDTFYNQELKAICEGDSLDFNGQILNQTGIYCQTFMAVNDCDSTHCIDLVVLSNVMAESEVTSCPNVPYIWNSDTLETSGIYNQFFTSSAGCDSTHSLTLTVLEEVITNEFIEFCEEDQPTWNGNPLLETGDYLFETIVQLPNGCDSIHLTEITVYPSPKISIEASPSMLWIGESAVLETNGHSAWTYLWTPADNLDCVDCPSPTATPTETTEYVLVTIDENGCESSDTIQLAVRYCGDTEIGVPNMITPNSDGVNDEFWLFEQGGLDKLEFLRVWDRWGNLVFQTNNLSEKWDAHYQGKKVSSGVFAYHIKGICIGGEEMEIQGNVTVIR